MLLAQTTFGNRPSFAIQILAALCKREATVGFGDLISWHVPHSMRSSSHRLPRLHWSRMV